MSLVFLEKIFGALYGNTIATNQPVDLSGAPSVALPSGTTINGAASTPNNISSNSATSFTVGPNGTTNPVLQVDSSVASQATGLKITGNAAGSNLQLSVISSGTNEGLYFTSKGTGTIRMQPGSDTTGAFALVSAGAGAGTTYLRADSSNKRVNIGSGAAPTGTLEVLSTSSQNFLAGATAANPVLQIDASVASVATGISIQGLAAGGNVQISIISSGTNEGMYFTSRGTGTLRFQPGTDTTGAIAFVKAGAQTGNTYFRADSTNGRVNVGSGGAPTGTLETISTSSSNFLAGASATNPVLQVDASTASVATGIKITGAATGGTTAIAVIDSGSNASLSISGKGTGTVTINSAVVAAAGGKPESGILFGSINVGVFTGTGAPSFSAMNGSIYVDSNATSTTTRIYVNKSGAGTAGTTWTNLTTAA